MSDRPPEKDFIKVRQCLTCSTHSPRCPNCFGCVTSRVIHCICDVTPPKGLPYKEALVLFSSSNQATPSDPSVLADFSSPSSVPDHSLWNPCACENRSHCARCGKCRRAAGCCTCSSPLPPIVYFSQFEQFCIANGLSSSPLSVPLSSSSSSFSSSSSSSSSSSFSSSSSLILRCPNRRSSRSHLFPSELSRDYSCFDSDIELEDENPVPASSSSLSSSSLSSVSLPSSFDLSAALQAAGLPPLSVKNVAARKSWRDLGTKRKRQVLDPVFALLRTILTSLDPSSPSSAMISDFLRLPALQSVIQKDSASSSVPVNRITRRQVLADSETVKALVWNYRSWSRRAHHIAILSILCRDFTMEEVRSTILPEVDSHLWAEARKFGDLYENDGLRMGEKFASSPIHRERVSKATLKSVIDFLFRPGNMHDSASAFRHVRIEGVEVSLAKMIRAAHFQCLWTRFEASYPKGHANHISRGLFFVLAKLFSPYELKAQSGMDNYLVDGLLCCPCLCLSAFLFFLMLLCARLRLLSLLFSFVIA
jgi:hypothetical protein